MTNCTASARMTTPSTHCRTVRASLVCAALIVSSGFLVGRPLPLRLDLPQTVARRRVKVQPVKLLQFPNALQGRRAKGRLAVEGMQHDAFQHVAQRHIVILRERLEYLENPLLHAHSGLHSLN